ncbi:MAG: hypothetical protein HOP95_08360 [Sphingomonas sp.]|nr:hypothetical protein [Sphingomonas sp.]
MRVRYVLKGQISSESFILDRELDISEMTVSCCTPGHLYLMYLLAGPKAYGSVNGPYGVIDLTEPH